MDSARANPAKTNIGISWQTDIQHRMWTAGRPMAPSWSQICKSLHQSKPQTEVPAAASGGQLTQGSPGTEIRYQILTSSQLHTVTSGQALDRRQALLAEGTKPGFSDATVKTHLGSRLWDWAKAGQSSDRASPCGFNPGIRVRMLPWDQSSHVSCSECCQTCLTWRCHMRESRETSIFSFSLSLSPKIWQRSWDWSGNHHAESGERTYIWRPTRQ